MKVLIYGVNGQDGSYLARLLLDKGYEVWGTSRDVQASALSNLGALSIEKKVNLLSMAPNDFRSVLNAVEQSEPDEIYYLSGQSSVGLSFEQPAETLESIVTGVLNILEVIRLRKKLVRLYNAGSSECFGNTNGKTSDETTPFYPRSPYAVAKASAHWLVANYREAYGLHASTGILFNHESPLRPSRFVTQKIIQTSYRIASGSTERLTLGRLDVFRDCGWAPEYVDAMWRMLQLDTPTDFVIATGKSHSLEDFVEYAFVIHGLNWRDYVDISSEHLRPADISVSAGNPEKARKILH
jgi:GDPmannose 4,6-dehydratase